MAKIKNSVDLWNLDIVQEDDAGNKVIGSNIVHNDGTVTAYPAHKKIIDNVNLLKSHIGKNGFVDGLLAKEIDTGEDKSPFSR